MIDGFTDIAPPAAATGTATTDQVTHGPSIPPQQRILLYSPEEWEGFIEEWAYFALKSLYVQVQRFTGPGDHGIDIAGFADGKKLQGVWDNYQCKRYLGHSIYPSEAWPEIGKILWHSFNKEYRPPRRYYFVALHGVGTTLAGYLGNAAKLKKGLIENWDRHARCAITKTQAVPLEGAFLVHVEAFDFSIFDSKSALEVIEGHRSVSVPCVPFWRGSSQPACGRKAARGHRAGGEPVRGAIIESLCGPQKTTGAERESAEGLAEVGHSLRAAA